MPFAFSDISDLLLHVNPYSIGTLATNTGGTTPVSADADPVRFIADDGPAGNDAVLRSGGTPPTYRTGLWSGREAIRFTPNGGYDLPSGIALPLRDFTLFVLIDGPPTQTGTVLSMGGSFDLWQTLYGRYPVVRNGGGNETKATMLASGRGPDLYIITSNGSTLTFEAGGIPYAVTTNVLPNSTVTGGGLGYLTAAPGSYDLAGDLYQLLLYGHALTDLEKAQVKTKLLADAGLSSITAPTRLAVFDGNSMTYGVSASGGYEYPQAVMRMLGPKWTHINRGISGESISGLVSKAAPIDALYDASREQNVYIGWEGPNSINTGGLTGAQAYTQYAAWLAAHRAVGWKVVACTITPWNIAGFEAKRQAFNALVRANYTTFADVLADLGADPVIGQPGQESDSTRTDGIHMTNLGYLSVAERVAQAIGQLSPASSGGSTAPTAEEVAEAVRTELTTELGRMDAAVSSRATPAQVTAAVPSAATVAAAAAAAVLVTPSQKIATDASNRVTTSNPATQITVQQAAPVTPTQS